MVTLPPDPLSFLIFKERGSIIVKRATAQRVFDPLKLLTRGRK